MLIKGAAMAVALVLALTPLLPEWGGLINSFEQESTVVNAQLIRA